MILKVYYFVLLIESGRVIVENERVQNTSTVYKTKTLKRVLPPVFVDVDVKEEAAHLWRLGADHHERFHVANEREPTNLAHVIACEQHGAHAHEARHVQDHLHAAAACI